MKNKGFTLIELLAVIVLLAIIALITIPIVLNTIKDSKEESNKISVDMYARALKNALLEYQLNEKNLGAIKLNTTDGKNFSNMKDLKVDYKGNVVCDTIEVYEETSIYLANCKVNGESVKYSYGEKKETPISFATDSWETIAKAVRDGNTSMYKVGDTKKIKLDEGFEPNGGTLLDSYTVRIANISSDDPICTTPGFSQTACGFVIEFVDIIEYGSIIRTTLPVVGGWTDSSMRKDLNEIIYSVLPEDLKKVIINTNVISSHGVNDEKNFETTDKLYLLSTKEVFGENHQYDTLVETRQLDYYKIKGVTMSNYSSAIKYFEGYEFWWWLRSAYLDDTGFYYYNVSDEGSCSTHEADDGSGTAPAFRIG